MTEVELPTFSWRKADDELIEGSTKVTLRSWAAVGGRGGVLNERKMRGWNGIRECEFEHKQGDFATEFEV
jgi:hypothetical protein